MFVSKTIWRGLKPKLTADLLTDAWAYVETCTATGKVPTIDNLAIKLFVHRDTLYAWEKPAGITPWYARPHNAT